MSRIVEVKVPDIGDFKDVPVIEILVKAGDAVKAEDSLITLESDKATMDVPAPVSGVVTELKVKVGDTVAEGRLIALVDTGEAGADETTAQQEGAGRNPARVARDALQGGRAKDAQLCRPGISASRAGLLAVADGDAPRENPLGNTALAARIAPVAAPAQAPSALPASAPAPAPQAPPAAASSGRKAHASPSVRHFARELGVDVGKVTGSGPKGRITQADVQVFVKGVMSGAAAVSPAPAFFGGGLDLLPWPKIDFGKFGEVEVKPLSRIRKISGQNLARNWAMIPAVTYHEDADITELEAFRVQMNKEHEKSGKKLTMLAFIIKAAVRALQEFPEFNTSLDGDSLVYKKYFNIAFAADTPNGLVVPVVKEADRKSVFEIAADTGALSKKAREGKLGPAEMSGACFTISSLGGIGGTYFAPIVNAPEVAILGVNKSLMKPVWDGKQFVPRLILPLSLTADHRVIDGALATRFNVYLAQLLADFRRVML